MVLPDRYRSGNFERSKVRSAEVRVTDNQDSLKELASGPGTSGITRTI
jgi:hypothetical protein